MDSAKKVEELLYQREQFRKNKEFTKADEARKQIEELGYKVIDTPQGTTIEKVGVEPAQKQKKEGPGKVLVFGSGEISPTGRKMHEDLIKDLPPPVKIALLETAAGFEENPHLWFTKLEAMMLVGLQNYKPQITRVEALRNDGEYSTNNPEIVKSLLEADYIHAGAGSPTYGVKHLRNSLAYQYIVEQTQKGTPLSLASATAMAFSKYTLPVYEIYKVGEDLHWKEGLNFFEQFGLQLTIVSHWNNQEGGDEIDTTRCFMGVTRFKKLLSLLPGKTTILGIDEVTACEFDFSARTVKVVGKGTATIMKNGVEKIIPPESTFSFDLLKL
jgi:hypothetical protein